MYLSRNWLQDFVKIKQTPEKLGLDLTMHTVEIEGVEKQSANLENIVVGKVLAVKKHPDADRLQIAITDISKEQVEIVCGGVNLKVGMMVAIALPGAKVRWHGEGDLVELRPTKVRGVESFGMICSSSEIGLGDIYPHAEKEILDLGKVLEGEREQSRLRLGDNLAKVLKLDDIIYEVDNKSINHRPDLWGHYGMAREIAAFSGEKLKEYKVPSIKDGKEIDLKVEVKDSVLCSRYLGLAVDNIKIAPSPDWMKRRLEACGVRSINNIVDITNYVLLELGQPMHAFDARLIEANKIIVRRAKRGEIFTTLDSERRKLDDSMLVIADSKKAVALAGVMGGENSEIRDDTKTVILESANFNPINIRKTSDKLGLRTESSTRFEKSLDPNMAGLAMKRVIELIKELIPEARVASKLIDVKKFKLNQGPIRASFDFFNKRIGEEIKPEKITGILKSLGFKSKKSAKELSVKVPSWRATRDISIPEDLIEEVARIYGYDELKPRMPLIPLGTPKTGAERRIERKIKQILALGGGMNEVYNYSFLSKKDLRKSGFPEKNLIELANAISKELEILRPSLIPGLLKNIEQNLKYFDEFNLFEIGRIFFVEDSEFRASDESKEFLPRQNYYLAGCVIEEKNETPFYRTKKIAENLFDELRLEVDFGEIKSIPEWIHPARNSEIKIKGSSVGLIGEINPLVLNNFGVKARVGVFEIDLGKVYLAERQEIKYQPLAKYPEAKLDLAIVVEEKERWGDIKKAILEVNNKIVRSVELFDIYRGKGMGAGKKSLAFHIVYRADDRTLETEEVEEIQNRIIKKLEEKFKAEIRK